MKKEREREGKNEKEKKKIGGHSRFSYILSFRRAQ
jgi:hypothetical protein